MFFVARRVTTAPENNHVPVIVAVIVVFILLILVFALFLFLWRWDMHALLYVMIVQSKKKPNLQRRIKKKIYEDILAVKQLFIFSDDFIFQLTTRSVGYLFFFFCNSIISVLKFLHN